MTASEKKERLLQALIERKGLQHLVDVAAEVFQNPLFIMDLSGKFLARSSRAEDRPIWEMMFPDQRLVAKDMYTVEKAGIFEILFGQDEPVFGRFDFHPARFLGCRIRDKDGAVGVATLVECIPVAEEDPELMVLLCKAALFEILYYEHTAMQTLPYFSILKDILEHMVNAEEARERIQAVHLKLPRRMRLAAGGYLRNGSPLALHFVRESVMASLEPCACILYENQLLVLLEENLCGVSVQKTLEDCFSGASFWIGISRSFEDILELPEMYEQVKAVRMVREKLQIEKRCLYYDDIFLYHFFAVAAGKHDLGSFCHPLLLQITAYDQKNHTELSKSIEAWLESGRNMQRAAGRLHMHKNTLYYRLKRAEELFHMDLDDENLCFLLQFSFRLRQMMRPDR